MKNPKINHRHLEEYRTIFGQDKMFRLWHDFLENAEQGWLSLNCDDYKALRLLFHSWKSSSLVFGMDDFSHCCAQIEENILSHHHWDKLAEMIEQSKNCYQDSVKEVNAYFAVTEN